MASSAHIILLGDDFATHTLARADRFVVLAGVSSLPAQLALGLADVVHDAWVDFLNRLDHEVHLIHFNVGLLLSIFHVLLLKRRFGNFRRSLGLLGQLFFRLITLGSYSFELSLCHFQIVGSIFQFRTEVDLELSKPANLFFQVRKRLLLLLNGFLLDHDLTLGVRELLLHVLGVDTFHVKATAVVLRLHLGGFIVCQQLFVLSGLALQCQLRLFMGLFLLSDRLFELEDPVQVHHRSGSDVLADHVVFIDHFVEALLNSIELTLQLVDVLALADLELLHDLLLRLERPGELFSVRSRLVYLVDVSCVLLRQSIDLFLKLVLHDFGVLCGQKLVS